MIPQHSSCRVVNGSLNSQPPVNPQSNKRIVRQPAPISSIWRSVSIPCLPEQLQVCHFGNQPRPRPGKKSSNSVVVNKDCIKAQTLHKSYIQTHSFTTPQSQRPDQKIGIYYLVIHKVSGPSFFPFLSFLQCNVVFTLKRQGMLSVTCDLEPVKPQSL